MAPLPATTPRTLAAIYAAYEAEHEHYDGLGISVGEAGTECDRALWYTFRWASPPEPIDGLTLSIFRTGNRWEGVLVSDLEAVGVDVYGQQDRIRLVAGHVRGKCDGKAMGVLEAPKTEHLCEFKSSNDAGFKQIVKLKCKAAKPLHYAQCQLGMHDFGLTRCVYYVVNKNDDARHLERIEYDAEFCLRLLARLERIIGAHHPPPRISDKPGFFGCAFCKHHAACHEDAMPRVTCRSCIYATPEMSGGYSKSGAGNDGHWSCARFNKPLSTDEQKAACPEHLHLPGLVPGEQIDADEELETITYKLRNGRIWTDGASEGENI